MGDKAPSQERDLMKLKALHSKGECRPAGWEEINADCASVRGLVAKTYKLLKKITKTDE